jgi:hypothetical protein
MIASTIYSINENGNIMPWKEFRNCEPIPGFVWAQVFSKYRYLKAIGSDQEVILSHDEIIRIIKLGEIDLDLFEQAVVAMTLEGAVVKREHFLILADLIDRYANAYAYSARTSLLMQAIALRDLYQNGNIIAACWQHGQDYKHWLNTGSLNEKGSTYNIFKNQRHWFMFVNGFLPPAHRQQQKHLVNISISYYVEDEITQDELNTLAEQYRNFTMRTCPTSEAQIKIEVSKINKRMVLFT